MTGIQIVITVFFLIGLGFVSIDVYFYLKRSRKRGDNHVTRTGETFDERASYHRRGELSPGEHAMARAIRESLRDKPVEHNEN